MSVSSLALWDGWMAFLGIAGWTLAAALTQTLGIWWTMGSAGLALGTTALAVDPALRHQLRPARAPAVAGMVAGSIMAAATYLVFPVTAHSISGIAAGTAALYRLFGGTAGAWRALLLCLIASAEEVVWRGAVQGALVRRYGDAAGVLLGATLYAAAVVPVGSPLLVVVSFGYGLAWGALAAWSGGLVTPILAHLVWTLAVLVLAPLNGNR